jgi:hypothetical protein
MPLDFDQYTQAEREECDDLGQHYSDFHKDLYGFRPRDVRMDDLEGLRAAVKRLDDGCKRQCMTPQGRQNFREQGYLEIANIKLGWNEEEYETWCYSDDPKAIAWKEWCMEQNYTDSVRAAA